MTLIVALACSDGLILASDSQATIGTSGQQVRAQVRKLHLQWNNIAWGGSGSVGLLQEAEEALSRDYNHTNAFEKSGKEPKKKISESIAKALRPILTGRFITIPGEAFPHTAFLFAGYSPEGPFIFELLPNLTTIDHLATAGFAAIGSGDIFPYFALASLAHFEVRKRTLADAKLIVYRTIQDAIKVAAYGLGPPIAMIEIVKPEKANEAGKGRVLDDGELGAIEEQVTAWKELERETLTKLRMPAPEPPEPPQAPAEAAPAPADAAPLEEKKN